jgi:sialate O-acetylesterase
VRPLHILALALLLAVAAHGQDLRLSSLFSDHMVLQRDMPIRVWGTAKGAGSVTVKLAGQEATAPVQDGGWQVQLPALPAGGPHELVVTLQGATLTLKDVLVGDLWVCSGQSNMEWALGGASNAAAAMDMADQLPQVRLYTVRRQPNDVPLPEFEVTGPWQVCSRDTARGFSAVGFFFGRHLNSELNVPIGLINSSWGGTTAQAWTDPQTFEQTPELKNARDQLQKSIADYAKVLAASVDDLAKWKVYADAEIAAGRTPRLPPRPMAFNDPRNSTQPGLLYNGMIHPLTRLPIKGVIWYQGEANASQSRQYRAIFPAMIEGWRRAWGQPQLPFLFVQLPNWKSRAAQPGNSDWAAMREAQAVALKLPQVEMAITLDVGEAGDIHPRNKLDVGRRLGLVALKTVYGRDVVYSGPRFKSMAVEGDAIRIRFDHVGGGLKAAGDKLASFAISGDDQKFVWAEATIDGESVVVRSPSVKQPAAVRYAWADNPEATLFNVEGLPAAPFRTDDWPMGY